jgi:hypothetical protein
MSGLSSLLGLDGTPHTSVDGAINTATNTAGTNAATDRNNYLDILKNGQNSLNTSIESATSAAMPALNQTLQSTREQGVKRGISTGDLGTSNEGDILSAFQRNIANSAGQQAMGLFNTEAGSAGNLYQSDNNNYLSMLRGNQDYQTGQQNAKRAKNSALFGGLGSAVGSIWGPTGSAIGGSIGSAIGG